MAGLPTCSPWWTREQKIYAKKSVTTRLPPDLGTPEPVALPGKDAAPERSAPASERDLEREADRLLANRYAPPGVIIDADMQILHLHGETGAFLEHAPGAASLNLLGMVRPGLGLDVRTAVHEARKEHRRVRREGMRTADDDNKMTVNVEVHPLGEASDHAPHFLVLFERTSVTSREPEEQEADDQAEPRSSQAAEKEETDRLRRELRETKAAMQSV